MRKLEWFNILPLGLSVFLVISRLLSNPGQFQNKIPLFQTISENRSRNAKKNLTSPNSSLISDTYELRVLIEKEPKIIAEENAVLAVWNQYKSEHSQMAVIRDWEQKERKRKFAIGYYSCPLQAGNRLHHFFNSLIWAIVTNRTLLWKYYDRESCRRVGYQYDKKICQAANTAEDCAQVLQRAQWLPEFDEWRYRWNFSSVKALSFWSTYEQLPKHKNWKEGNEKYAGMADTTEHLVVEYAQMLGQDARVLRRERKRDYLLKSSNSRERARRLFERGPDYLYGLLFKETFEFQPSVIVPMQPIGNTTQGSSGREKQKSVSKQEIYQSDGSNYSKESLTVVLHSRHSSTEDDGSKIKREKLCFDKIIQSQTRASLCQVLLLSDRPNTLTKAAEYLADRYPHCHVMVAPHDTGQSFRVEHGPFSGSGFFQDLSFIANQSHGIPTARTAFIGSDHRSSSMLVQEILVYQLQSRNQQTQLETCYLEHT